MKWILTELRIVMKRSWVSHNQFGASFRPYSPVKTIGQIMPELSICVLTRNNYETCKITISGILKDAQLGFELLVIDASENPVGLKLYIDSLDDDRVRHVQVGAKDRQAHWNQAIPECKGEWITFISDADHIDPKIVQIVKRLKLESPDVDSLGWNKVNYDWPEHRNEVRATKISTKFGAFIVDKSSMQKRFFGFEREGLIPFNIYHGIVKRDLVERIRNRFGDVYFEHPITSYEFGYKVLMEANELAFTERALSILSAQSEDLLSEVSGQEDFEVKKVPFYQDIKLEEDSSKFPFTSDLSPKILGAIALQWLIDKYGEEFFVDGWERNFVKRREDECNALYSNDRFKELSASYRKVIGNWSGGDFSNLFAPQYNQSFANQKEMVGCFHGFLFLGKNAHGSTNPAEFYAAFENFVPPSENIGIKIVEKKRKVA